MAGGSDRFDAEAAAWDSNPDVQRASDDAVAAILERLQHLRFGGDDAPTPVNGLEVLEIGCGTGLLSYRMSPHVHSLLAVDSSKGMIAALQSKLASDPPAASNITPLNVMLEDPEDARLPPANGAPQAAGPRKKFDLVLSHLVLHHIPDLPAVLNTMYGCLKPNGHVMLTDYEDFGPEARKFHPEAKMAGVERHGIDRAEFAAQMRDAGFVDINVEKGWVMKKDVEKWPGEWGQIKPEDEQLEQMDFPFLICIGRRPL